MPKTAAFSLEDAIKVMEPYVNKGEEFDFNNNGIMEEDEKAAEAAYIRHIVEKESEEDDSEEEITNFNE